MEKLIENIEIKNFKSIRQLTMNDCRRINLLIGYPNVGKSNLLEALSLFSIQEGSDFSLFIRLEINTTLFFDGNIEESSEVIINNKHRYRTKYRDSLLFFDLQYDSESAGFDDAIFSSRTDVTKFIYDGTKIDNISHTELKVTDRLPEIKKYEFLKKVNYTEGSFDKLIQPYGNNIFDVISTHESIRKDIAGLFKRYDLKFAFDKSLRVYKVLKDLGEDIFLVPYSMVADTLQRLIFYKTAILSNKDSVLLFEEPEAHMFPPYISKFTGDIWNNKENQYFIATHSPFVVNDFMENAKDELAIFLLDYKDGETIVKRLTEEQVHEAYQYGLELFLNVQSLME